MIPFPEPFTGSAVIAWRTGRGETQSAFAARIGVTAASISPWEKRGAAPIGMLPRTLTALKTARKKTNS